MSGKAPEKIGLASWDGTNFGEVVEYIRAALYEQALGAIDLQHEDILKLTRELDELRQELREYRHQQKVREEFEAGCG